MRTIVSVALAVFVLAAVAVRADDHPEMAAAKQDLQSARRHLQAASGDKGGHRERALDATNRAIEELNAALARTERRDKKDDTKVRKLEKKDQNLQHRIDKLKND
jgi:septal ring factor EnvC (AmiA/AmiB activator)